MVTGPLRVDRDVLERAGPRLKMVATPGIGVDKIDVEAASERGIIVIHNPDAPTESTAEHAVALLMAMAARVSIAEVDEVCQPGGIDPETVISSGIFVNRVVESPQSSARNAAE